METPPLLSCPLYRREKGLDGGVEGDVSEAGSGNNNNKKTTIMKNFIKAFRLTIVMCVFLGIGYVLVLWAFGKVASQGNGNAETVTLNGKVVGAANVGQQFTKDIYFWGRPSCAGDGYDAANSCGSNKGPTNPEYLAEVETRIDSFLLHHPYLQREDVPAEMVTASGSGLDPDITPQSARVQVKRVAAARSMDEQQVAELVEKSIERPLFGLFGPEKVNVLKLNVALDKLTSTLSTSQMSNIKMV